MQIILATTTGYTIQTCVRSRFFVKFLCCRQRFQRVSAGLHATEIIDISTYSFTERMNSSRNLPVSQNKVNNFQKFNHNNQLVQGLSFIPLQFSQPNILQHFQVQDGCINWHKQLLTLDMRCVFVLQVQTQSDLS